MSEDIYIELDQLSAQSYISTASGLYLDRLIDGTYGIKRGGNARSFGYVTMYGNSPIQQPGEFTLRCAIYNAVTDVLTYDVGAVTFVSKETGQVFTLVAPNNTDYIKYDVDRNPVITLQNQVTTNIDQNYSQFLVLPVVSSLRGLRSNVPETSIDVIPSNITGIIGVSNTYQAISTLLSNEKGAAPYSTRYTNLTDSKLAGTDIIISVINAFNFSAAGVLEFSTIQGGKYLATYREIDQNTNLKTKLGKVITEVLRPQYSQAQSKYITIPASILPRLKKYNTLGYSTEYELESILYPEGLTARVINTIEEYRDFFNFNSSFPDSPTILKLHAKEPLIVRQSEVSVDRGIIFDPDNVVGEDGKLVDSAHITGGSEADSDEEYRIKLQKYLASLGRSTPTALEAGAMTIPGVTYAKTASEFDSPRGTAVLLVSGPGGSLGSNDLYRIRTTLDRQWKAAGVRLIVKVPEKVELSISLKLQRDARYSKSAVDKAVKQTIREYFLKKIPGDEVRYSELISSIQGINGIINVFNVYLGRKITSQTFLRFRWLYTLNSGISGGYFNDILLRAKAQMGIDKNYIFGYWKLENGQYKPFPVDPLTVQSAETLYEAFALHLSTGEKATPVNSILSQATIDRWNAFRRDLVLCDTLDKYEQFIANRRLDIFGVVKDEDFISKVITLTTEPLDLQNFYSKNYVLPIDFYSLPVSSLVDFKPTSFQIPSEGSLRVGAIAYPMISIEYPLENS